MVRIPFLMDSERIALQWRRTVGATLHPEIFRSASVRIEYVSDYLKNNAGQIRIEGHCDERGTEGYNLALGERRAQAVRGYLIDLGNDLNRIYTVSFGETQPAALGNTREAYEKNRRGEFVLLVP